MCAFHVDNITVERCVKKFGVAVAKNILPSVEHLLKVLNVKPALSYLEIHLVDHCNLNCKGCSHFAPIADEWFADTNEYARDMQQLRKLFLTIHKIRLLGGEPLLHPKIARFMFFTRSCFPKADVRIVTNGIILHRMPDLFWKACRAYSIGIDFTVYPPLFKKEKFLVKMANEKGVKIYTRRASSVQTFYNLKGDSDPNVGYQICCHRGYANTPNLREGKFYICPAPSVIHYFNKRYGTQIPSAGYVDIYAPNLSGWDVRKILDRGSATCRYCTAGWDHIPKSPWSTSKLHISEWDAATRSS